MKRNWFVISVASLLLLVASVSFAGEIDPRDVGWMVLHHPYVQESSKGKGQYMIREFPFSRKVEEDKGKKFYLKLIAFIDSDEDKKVSPGDVVGVFYGKDEKSPIDFQGEWPNAIFRIEEDGYARAYLIKGEKKPIEEFDKALRLKLENFSDVSLKVALEILKIEKEARDVFQEYMDDLNLPWQERLKKEKQGI